jgi:FtsP/CotA-like multicopper oxidase with cupredoxin domain
MASMRRYSRFSALALALSALAAAHAAVLHEMSEATSTGGVLTTTIVVDEYTASFTEAVSGSAFSYKTRGYDPAGATMTDRMAVGPTLRFSAGDSVKVTLDNDLDANPGTTTTMNTMHSPGTTNLHTHGLHVDSDTPQDNVYIAVDPGDTFEYTYTIASDHAAGTHWYHAHFHGNTALQVGNGLVGMIVVEDAADEIPADLAALDELALMVQRLEPFAVQTVAGAFEDGGDGWTQSGNVGLADGESYWTVNGQINPAATVTQNQWTRVRVAYSSLNAAADIELLDADSLGCEWKLLAKDGIYVDNAPRELTIAHVAPGNRFDFVVKCASAGSFTLTAAAEAGGGPGGGGGGPGGRRKLLQTAETLMTFTVSASAASTAGDLTVFTPKKPVYLQDVYDEALHSVTHTSHELRFARADGGCAVSFDGDERAYDGTAHGSMAVGSVQAWQVSGNDKHPFHIHINSFQLGSDVVDASGYYQTGDWHDVFYRPADVTASKIYFQVDQHTGKAVLHCHFLEHEDKGCMAYVDITGVDDTRVSGLAASDLVETFVEDTTATGEAAAPEVGPAAAEGVISRKISGGLAAAAIAVALA